LFCPKLISSQKAGVLSGDTFLLTILRIYAIPGRLTTNQILTPCIGELLLYFIWDELRLYNGASFIFLHSEQLLANDDSMKEKKFS
jgi:hypothetical protein